MGQQTRVRQWLLLCALAFAVIGMHHVARAPHEASHVSVGVHDIAVAQWGADGPGTDVDHTLLHLCLAVLCATGGVLLAWLLTAIRWRPSMSGATSRPLLPRLWRPPRPSGRSLLTVVCVSRT